MNWYTLIPSLVFFLASLYFLITKEKWKSAAYYYADEVKDLTKTNVRVATTALILTDSVHKATAAIIDAGYERPAQILQANLEMARDKIREL